MLENVHILLRIDMIQLTIRWRWWGESIIIVALHFGLWIISLVTLLHLDMCTSLMLLTLLAHLVTVTVVTAICELRVPHFSSSFIVTAFQLPRVSLSWASAALTGDLQEMALTQNVTGLNSTFLTTTDVSFVSCIRCVTDVRLMFESSYLVWYRRPLTEYTLRFQARVRTH